MSVVLWFDWYYGGVCLFNLRCFFKRVRIWCYNNDVWCVWLFVIDYEMVENDVCVLLLINVCYGFYYCVWYWCGDGDVLNCFLKEIVGRVLLV